MEPAEQLSWNHVRNQFRRIWGYDDFRPPQGEIIQTLLQGTDTLVVLATGGGKSICFQLPALLQDGLTLVVSPLVALMENQVQELHSRQLPAALLHNEISKQQRKKTFQALARNQLRLLYLSPETLLSPPVWDCLCQRNLPINGLILDEAHCLVQWGDTFRPAYRRLGTVRSHLLKSKPPGSKMAIAAFTATADPIAQQTITEVLQLNKPEKYLYSPYRPNLYLQVKVAWTPRGRRQQLLTYIKQHIKKRPSQAGLVYVRSRKDSEELAQFLGQQGYQTRAYHGGLSAAERRFIEQAWIGGDLPFVVCTCAFGMGVNKPDVRWVVHFQAPSLLSEYIQEVGRAGRDGKRAEALTLVSECTGFLDPQDKQRREFFTQQGRSLSRRAQQLAKTLPKTGKVEAVARKYKEGAIALSLLHSQGQLQWRDPFHYVISGNKPDSRNPEINATKQMEQYLITRGCRWQFLLQAFGFDRDAKNLRCGHCDRCCS
jgi:ATP-dependent DNA helicase RecQ